MDAGDHAACPSNKGCEDYKARIRIPDLQLKAAADDFLR